MTTFLLIVNRCERFDGGFDSAITMARRRLEAGKWALYANTPHRGEMKAGDRVLVYLAGAEKEARHFVAAATISGLDASARANLGYKADGPDALAEPPVAVLSLVDVHWLSAPVPIGSVKDDLDFVPKGTNKWGCVLQRGAKRIGEPDTERILGWRP
jgi:hypothetical protein